MATKCRKCTHLNTRRNVGVNVFLKKIDGKIKQGKATFQLSSC